MAKQVAFVTGSSRGIGLGIARALAEKGFSVALNGTSDSEKLGEALEEIRSMGVDACKVVFDVGEIQRFPKVLDEVEEQLGPLTTLVNNAGISVMNRGDMLEVSEESYDRCLLINTKAVFFLCQSYSKRLLARKRDPGLYYSIVNVTSANAKAIALQRAEYTISKAGAAMASQNWAARLGPENICVYDVQPGLIATDMTEKVIKSYEERAKDGLTLLPRVGSADDIGRTVAALASGALPYVTGQTISADGGLLVPRF